MQQGGQVFQNLSVWENLEVAFGLKMDGYFEQLREIIPLLQLPKRKLQHQMADKLSGGQKHQLALAMALATHPKLVILDEPSAGLAPKAVEEMYAILQATLKAMDLTIVLIEQNISKAALFSGRCYFVKNGCVSNLPDNNFKNIIQIIF